MPISLTSWWRRSALWWWKKSWRPQLDSRNWCLDPSCNSEQVRTSTRHQHQRSEGILICRASRGHQQLQCHTGARPGWVWQGLQGHPGRWDGSGHQARERGFYARSPSILHRNWVVVTRSSPELAFSSRLLQWPRRTGLQSARIFASLP